MANDAKRGTINIGREVNGRFSVCGSLSHCWLRARGGGCRVPKMSGGQQG